MSKPFNTHSLTINGQALINGQRCWAQDRQTFASISPVNGSHIADIARGQQTDIDHAVAAAKRAFDDKRWVGLTPAKRKKILLHFSDLILDNTQELAYLETMDMGKPIQYAKKVDVPATANCIRWYAEALDKVYGEIAPTPQTALALITQEALGVVGVIVPWNYPMIMAAWKIAPALAMGNSVVLKPSEKSPLTALRLGDLALEAGIPAGVFNVVPGFGPEAGAALALHMDVDCIAFTGSTKVGKQIHVMAGQSNLKRAWTELGGKSPNIVFADCPNLDQAAQAAVQSIFFNQGQSCNAPSRLFVETGIKDRFLEKVLAQVPQYQPTNPLDEESVMGALVDATQMRTVLNYIDSGNKAGAKLLTGGEQVLSETGGFYVQATVFDGVSSEMQIAREEIFGPVLSVLDFSDIDSVVREANATTYGLQAGVWTSDLSKAIAMSRALKAGTVHINQYDEDDITVPFGGFKQSGIGRDKSLHALEKYTETKTTWIRVDSPL